MEVTLYGTRGSTAVSGKDSVRYGGNTTCVRVNSPCLGEGVWLAIDAGTGFVPFSRDFLQQGGKELILLFSHWHHDHTQGFPLSPLPYIQQIPLTLFGPYEHGIGGEKVYKEIMKPPLFPVPFEEVASHLNFRDVRLPTTLVLAIHPRGGVKVIALDDFQHVTSRKRQLQFSLGNQYSLEECLIIKMHKSNHPEHTISYRFEEGPTGKVFVFVTDHENQAAIPTSFKQHVKGADLLIMDCQYTREKYTTKTAGWGHATPDYVADVARQAGAKRLGLTHHDPFSTDTQVDAIIQTAQVALKDTDIDVFGCHDYDVVPVGVEISLAV
ncbi:MAG: MBL fold metallo-hydrolase [bacterium]|nr:MBL fold metallo-hydrolase [bacterium]